MHKGIFVLCTCALIKPFGHFLVGLVFDFWRDVGRDRGHRTNQHTQIVCESNAGCEVWYGINRSHLILRYRGKLHPQGIVVGGGRAGKKKPSILLGLAASFLV